MSEVVDKIDVDNILNHVKTFSSFGTRVTGTEGCKQAANYIYEYFNNLTGVDEVIRQEYNVTLPVDRGANITILSTGEVITAHPLWPNLVQASPTPPEGLEGRLVYVGAGEYSDFNQNFAAGDIVLMDFNTGKNWLHAAELGAKAVIFIEPPSTDYYEEMAKFLMTPVYFPRLFVSAADGEYLIKLAKRQGGVTVNIKSDIRYEYTTAENIIAIVKGDPGNPTGLEGVKEEIIMVGAYYDDWSVVPAIAPGADESTGVSTLLELARFFSENRPKRTMWFVALSGHWQALAGAREFTEKYYFYDPIKEGSKVVWAFMGLDFSTDMNKVGIVSTGHMYKFGPGPEMYWVLPRYDTWINPTIVQYLSVMENQIGKPFTKLVQNSLRADWFWATIPTPYILDSETIAVAGGASFTLRTTDTYRFHWGMFDTLEKVNRDNLEIQVQVAACFAYGFANEPTVSSATKLKQILLPQRLYVGLGGAATGAGFNTLVGEVLTYNTTKGWYDKVPNALVHVRIRIQEGAPFYPFTRIIQYADENGNFEIHGLGPGVTAGSGQHQRVLQSYYVEAYHLDNKTGLIDYAPDLGIYGIQSFDSWVLMGSYPAKATTVVFKCAAVTVFSFVDPTVLGQNTLYDPRHSGRFTTAGYEVGWTYGGGYAATFYEGSWSIEVYDLYTLSPPLHYGYYYAPQETVAMFFVPLKVRCAFIYRYGITVSLGAAFLNTSDEYPEGYGYYLEGGELKITNTPYQVAKSLVALTSSRYNILREKFVRGQISESALSRAVPLINEAKTAIDNRIYDKAYVNSINAWLEVIRAYEDTMNLIQDASRSVAVFFALLIPFSLIFERLVFQLRGFRRLLITFATPFILTIAFYNVHPGLKLVSNSIMSLMGLVLEIFFLTVLLFLVSRAMNMARELQIKMLGLHFERRITLSEKAAAFTHLSILHLRKRRLRSVLNIFVLTTIIFSLVSLTSTFCFAVTRTGRVDWSPSYEIPYTGLLIERGRERLQNLLTDYLANYLKLSLPESCISSRVWLYPQSNMAGGGSMMVEAKISTKGGNKTYSIKGILGIDPEEFDIGIINKALLTPLRFDKDDYNSCILTKSAAQSLGVDIGDKITWSGITLTVKGIVDETILNTLIDLDAKSITLWDPNLIAELRTAPGGMGMEDQYTPLPWESILIVPSRLALRLGGYIRSIAIRNNSTLVEELAKQLALNLRVEVYASLGEEIRYYSRYSWYSFQGWQILLVPMILSAFTILTTMLGSVTERTREISIYSSLGLSPSGIASQFLCEAIVLSVLSTLVGYLAGIAINGYLIASNFLPENFLMNSSSISVLMAIGLSVAATTVSTLYPAFKASRLVTPSLERKWKPPTKPIGDRWFIPLPFSSIDPQEAHGILNYLAEYFTAYLNVPTETFVVREVEQRDNALRIRTDLQPAEAHISQNVLFTYTPKEGRYNFTLDITRLSGSKMVWRSSNLRFIDAFRKQLLRWRSLTPQERDKYMTK